MLQGKAFFLRVKTVIINKNKAAFISKNLKKFHATINNLQKHAENTKKFNGKGNYMLELEEP